MYRFYQRVLAVAAAMLFLVPVSAMANDTPAAWTVSQRSGDVRILRSGAQPIAVVANAQLSPGDVVSTGPNGRVMLTRGGDYIVVAPGSRLLLPSAAQPSGFTRLIQQVGTMFYKVKHTGVPHFIVDAPMLAAVVKGTSFTVIVDDSRSAVQVTDGVVEVTAADGGMRSLVEHGNTVFISRLAPKSLLKATSATIGLSSGVRGTKDETIAIAGTPEQTESAVAAQTGGLVRVDVAAVPAQIAVITPSVGQVQTGSSTVSSAVSIATGTAPPVRAEPAVTTPAVAAPAVSTPAVVTPVVTPPPSGAPSPTVPAVTAPAVTTPAVTTPAVTIPAVTVPAITVPAVTVPAVTVPAITVPAVTVPAVTVPAVTVPAVTVPAITVPAVTVPAVTVPAITVPAITVPAITVPPVTLPRLPLPPFGH